MADLPPTPGSNGESDDDTSGRPRWVKALGIIVVVLVLVFVIMHLAGGGFVHHTPRSSDEVRRSH